MKRLQKTSVDEIRTFRYIPFANVVGIMLGGIGGYIYYLKVVCVTGGCPLTSNPIITIVWGGSFRLSFF